MSDPAIEAAQRACEAQGDDLVDNDVAVDTAIAAAREALAKVRELHRKVSKRNGWTGHFEDICLHCQNPWPCDTAKLSYPSEELS